MNQNQDRSVTELELAVAPYSHNTAKMATSFFFFCVAGEGITFISKKWAEVGSHLQRQINVWPSLTV
jgi:hypothetical protein